MKKDLIKFKLLQVSVDAILILAAFALAYFVRIGWYFSSDFPFDRYAVIALLTLPFTLAFMFFARTYKLSQQIWSWRHFQRIVFAAVMNVAVFMIFYYFLFRNFFSRLILIYVFAFTATLIYLWHAAFRKILQLAYQRETGVYRTLIIGTNRPAQAIVHQLTTVKSHIKPVAILDAYGSHHKEIHGVPVLGKMDKFEKVIREYEIDQIIQVDNLEQSVNLIQYALQNNIQYLMPPELLGIFQGHHSVENWEGMPFLKVQTAKRWWHKIW